MLLGYLFDAVNHFGSVLLLMTGLAQCFHCLWSVVGILRGFPPLDPMAMMHRELRCSSTSLTLAVGSSEYFSSIGFIFRSGFVSRPHIFHCGQDIVLALEYERNEKQR
jgi:hypothetical protein